MPCVGSPHASPPRAAQADRDRTKDDRWPKGAEGRQPPTRARAGKVMPIAECEHSTLAIEHRSTLLLPVRS